MEGQTLVEVFQDNEDMLGSDCEYFLQLWMYRCLCKAMHCNPLTLATAYSVNAAWSCEMLDAGLCISPEGRGQNEAHITLPNEYLTRFPPPDQRTLEDVASRITPK